MSSKEESKKRLDKPPWKIPSEQGIFRYRPFDFFRRTDRIRIENSNSISR